MGRKAVEMGINFVVIVLIVLAVAMWALGGINLAGTIFRPAGEGGKEYTYQVSGNFPQICDDWISSSEKYVPSYILGGPFRPSVTKAAETQGSKFACCAKSLNLAAENLKSKGKYFTSDEADSWALVNRCLDACQAVVNARTTCNNNNDPNEKFDQCMTRQLESFSSCKQ